MEFATHKTSTGGIDILQDIESYNCIARVWGPKVSGLPQETTDRLAALFVAAPDLLEALKEIERFCENLVEPDVTDPSNREFRVNAILKRIANNAKAAIAKAEPTTTEK